jgi:hypothetical protein
MDLKKLIKEVLYGDCCKAIKPTKAPILNENLAPREILSEGLKYHIDNKKPLTEHVYRAGSQAYFNLWAEARALYVREILDFSGDDLAILTETDLGEFGIYEGKKVPLDFIMEEEESFPFEYKGFKYNIEVLSNTTNDRGQKLYKISIDGVGSYNEYTNERDAHIDVKREIDDQLMFEGTLTEDNIAELQKIKKEIEALMPRLSWIDDVTFSDFNGDLDIELDYELNPQEIKQLSQVASKYDMRLIYKTGKNATLTKRRIPSKINELDEAKAKPKKKNPPIGKPMRGGSKKFYVYVKAPGGKIKKVSFGQAGMSAKINNPEARRAFAARHDCKNKKDRTKASYWSCRLPRYAKLLGLKSNFSGFW